MPARTLLLLTIASLYGSVAAVSDPGAHALAKAVHAVIQDISSKTGYALSVGYVDSELEFGVGSGPSGPSPLSTNDPVDASTTVNGRDHFAFGSGSKPFTSAAVLRLMEQGKLQLDDKASTYIDPVLAEQLGGDEPTTLVGLFGPQAENVTVGHLITMQSGINDFDIPDFDHKLLMETDPTTVTPPIEFLRVVANMSKTFVCEPGNCTCYSSTNFVLAACAFSSSHSPPPPMRRRPTTLTSQLLLA